MKHLLNTEIDLYRKTDILLDQIITATMYVDYQPTGEILIIEISGASTGTGTITVNGTVAGSPDSEVFTFTANGFREGEKTFTNISSILSSGFIDESVVGSIRIKDALRTGEPNETERLIKSGIKARKYKKSIGDGILLMPGSSEKNPFKLIAMYDSSYSFLREDIVKINSISYKVVDPPNLVNGYSKEHHWEVNIEEL